MGQTKEQTKDKTKNKAVLGGILTAAKSFLFAAEGVEGADFLYVCPKNTDLLFSMIPISISKYRQVSLWTGKIKKAV